MATKRTATFTVTDMSTNKAISARANVIFPLADFYIKNEKGEKINEYKVGEHITLIIETEGEREKEFTIDLSEQDAIFEDENGQKVEDKFKKKVVGTEGLNLKLKVAQRKETKKRLREITVTDDKENSKRKKAHCKEVGIWIVFGEGINDKYQYKNQKLNDVDGNEIDMDGINNSFVSGTFEVLNYLVDKGAGDVVTKTSNNIKYGHILSFGEVNVTVGNISHWNPDAAYRTKEGNELPPFSGLVHELGHNYYNVKENRNWKTDDDYSPTDPYFHEPWNDPDPNKAENKFKSENIDPEYDSYDEYRVINDFENPVLKKLGYKTRKNHKGSPYKTYTPYSTDER